jgi:hypothetical protein
MQQKLHGTSILRVADAFLAIKLAKEKEECPICQNPFAAGETLIERYCCHLLTHVSCLSQWANTTPIKLGVPLGSPSEPLQTFSCPKCRRDAFRTRYFEILDKAFPPNAKATNDTSAAGEPSIPKTLTKAHNTKPPPKPHKPAKLGCVDRPNETSKVKKSSTWKGLKLKLKILQGLAKVRQDASEPQEFSEDEV